MFGGLILFFDSDGFCLFVVSYFRSERLGDEPHGNERPRVLDKGCGVKLFCLAVYRYFSLSDDKLDFFITVGYRDP